jgi:hypothetical protein
MHLKRLVRPDLSHYSAHRPSDPTRVEEAQPAGGPACPGQSRRFDSAPLTSGLPRSADNPGAGRHVPKVPGADLKTLHLRRWRLPSRMLRP